MPRTMQSSLMTLEAFELVAEHQPLAVAELARLLGRPKSSAQRALLTLRDAGWIRPDGADRTRWVPTAKVLGVALQVGNATGLRDAAGAVMRKLRDLTGEGVLLCVRDRDDSVSADFVESRRSVRFVTTTGIRVPLHAGANGKAILAFLPESEVARYVAGDLRSFTANTLTTRDTLLSHLEEVRAQGYAASRDEVVEELAGVAAPIFDGAEPVASVAITLPSHRFFESDLDRLGAMARGAAQEISTQLAR